MKECLEREWNYESYVLFPFLLLMLECAFYKLPKESNIFIFLLGYFNIIKMLHYIIMILQLFIKQYGIILSHSLAFGNVRKVDTLVSVYTKNVLTVS